MGEHHWSVARKSSNQEALDYYRERSKAPGVEDGGGARNHYCMNCDGVIPFEHRGDTCPHCSAALDDGVRRYFNWVEIDQPPSSDLIPLLKVAVPVLLVLAALGILILRWIFGG